MSNLTKLEKFQLRVSPQLRIMEESCIEFFTKKPTLFHEDFNPNWVSVLKLADGNYHVTCPGHIGHFNMNATVVGFFEMNYVPSQDSLRIHCDCIPELREFFEKDLKDFNTWWYQDNNISKI